MDIGRYHQAGIEYNCEIDSKMKTSIPRRAHFQRNFLQLANEKRQFSSVTVKKSAGLI